MTDNIEIYSENNNQEYSETSLTETVSRLSMMVLSATMVDMAALDIPSLNLTARVALGCFGALTYVAKG